MEIIMETASFNRFELWLTKEDADRCHHSGACDDDVHTVSQGGYVIEQLDRIDKVVIRAVLKEYGVWDSGELADDEENRRRIVWLAAGDIQEERK
jgi:hypothetical protein